MSSKTTSPNALDQPVTGFAEQRAGWDSTPTAGTDWIRVDSFTDDDAGLTFLHRGLSRISA